MTQPVHFVEPVDVEFGGKTVTAASLKGLKRIRAFESALLDEVDQLKQRIEGHAREGAKVSPAALLELGVDEAKLLKVAMPEVITDELLEESTAPERQGLLMTLLRLNNLSRFGVFFTPELILELGMRINSMVTPVPDFPMPESNGSSSEPVSAGTTSSVN
jgi:hypothetical protein